MEKEPLQLEPPLAAAPEQLDGWKEIAAYLNRTVRTVQRWEKEEGLPVHRHQHQKLGSVRASKTELDEWVKCRQSVPIEIASPDSLPASPEPVTANLAAMVPMPVPQVAPRRFTRQLLAAVFLAGLTLLTLVGYWAVKPPPSPVSAVLPATRNAAAYEAYLKGQYAWHRDTRDGFEQSVQLFEQAVALDPKFAPAWAELATAYTTMGLFGIHPPKECFPQAQSAAERALALDTSLAEAHAALAQVKFYWQWDWQGAEQEFRAAIALNPTLANPHQSYAYLLSALGRHAEAIAEARQAQELEPLSATINSNAGWFYYMARRYDEALTQWRKALELEPHFIGVQSGIVTAYYKQGKYEQARTEAIKYLRMINLGAQVEELNTADPQEALQNFNRLWIQQLQQLQSARYVAPAYFIKAYAELNEPEQLFQWLETALAERDCVILLLNVHPLFDQFRTDPRFLELSARLSLLSERRQG